MFETNVMSGVRTARHHVPRMVERGWRRTIFVSSRQFVAANRPTSLIERLATTEEVANMVVYVASEQASATTGAALRVDGGVVRAIP